MYVSYHKNNYHQRINLEHHIKECMQKGDHDSQLKHNSHDFVVETAENECNNCTYQMDAEEGRQSHIKSTDDLGCKLLPFSTDWHTHTSLIAQGKQRETLRAIQWEAT